MKKLWYKLTTRRITKQEAFDRALTHMRKQGKKSITHTAVVVQQCAYRGANGTKCAIGALIPDKRYSPSLEGTLVNEDIAHRIGLFDHNAVPFLLQLQRNLHDGLEHGVEELENNAEAIAILWNLKYTPAEAV